MIVPPGGIGALLVLSRKSDRAHLTLQFDQGIDGLVRRVEELTLQPGIGATAAKVIGFRYWAMAGRFKTSKPPCSCR